MAGGMREYSIPAYLALRTDGSEQLGFKEHFIDDCIQIVGRDKLPPRVLSRLWHDLELPAA